MSNKYIYSKKLDLILIKFPIIFPVIYGIVLFSLPSYENLLILLTLLLLAEPHFGATWPFFLNKNNFVEIKKRNLRYIFAPILIIIFSVVGFFYFNNIFLLIFFILNMIHVTRQSYGISKLYIKNSLETKIQENIIYIFNIILFLIAIFRFYIPVINQENIFILNIIIIFFLFLIYVYYYIKFKNFENLLLLITGTIIFLPICFVTKPIHAIIMGVTIHYTQYLCLTHMICKKRNLDNNFNDTKQNNILKFFYKKNFILIIGLYALLMTGFSSGGSSSNDLFKNLIFIPITSQILHFYLDAFLWKFSEKHNRENTLKFLS